MELELAENVVVDAVAFFKNVQLQTFAKQVFTVHDVVNEIRDAKTRERLAVLPYELQFREPSAESIQFVSEFSRKTGEYQSLSPVDIRVMALAHQLTKEHMGTEHLKQEPEKKMTFSSNRKPLEKSSDIAGFYFPAKNESPKDNDCPKDGDVPLDLTKLKVDGLKNESTDCTNSQGVSQTTENETSISAEALLSRITHEREKEIIESDTEGLQKTKDEDGENFGITGENRIQAVEESIQNQENDRRNETETKQKEGDDKDLSDEGLPELDEGEQDDDHVGWITPQNLQKVKDEMRKDILDSLAGVKVACLTSDFAMQNVLIQMGIPVLSLEGMIIKKAKSFALRCFACFKVTSDTSRKFCPKCGNQTLNKVSVTVDDEGNIHYHMSRRRRYKLGELRQSLPMPKGGKHAFNPMVCEDQPQPQNYVSRKARVHNNVFDPDYVAQNSPFVTRDVTSRSALLGVGRRQNRRGRRK